MAAIKELRTVQYRIFEPYVLPFAVLMSSFGREALRRVFGFSQVDDSQVPELYFSNGVVRLDEEGKDTQIVIANLHLNERRIILEVVGSTSDANTAFGMIFHAIMTMRKEPPEDATPVVLTHESTCVIHLPFSWDRLLPEPLVRFVGSDICEAASREGTTARILWGGVGIRLVFSSEDPRIDTSGITLAEKQVVIEPRMGTAASDRLYFVRAPTDTDALLRLTAKLSKVLK